MEKKRNWGEVERNLAEQKIRYMIDQGCSKRIAVARGFDFLKAQGVQAEEAWKIVSEIGASI